MIVVPVIVSVIWITLVQARGEGDVPLAPMTTAGRIALGSVALVIVVALADASLAVTLPAGVVMLGLGSFARWGRHDPGLLLVLPLVFGASALALPMLFE